MAKAHCVLFSCLVLNVLDLGSTSDINGTVIDTARVDYPRIWLLGDSLTQLGFSAEGCWATILANHYSSNQNTERTASVPAPLQCGSTAAFMKIL
ncbi:uncharacterized protein LOC144108035 isoform X2 [Amblyomma americanum]